MKDTFYTPIAVVSTHLDDGIFSLGDFIQVRNVTIVCPFGGIPDDEIGKNKYITLHAEHSMAALIMGCKIVDGDFLDDVYPGLDEERLYEWLNKKLQGYELVLVPLGIKHPDHIAVRKACNRINVKKMYFSDLPYATDYPEEEQKLTQGMKEISIKEAAVRAYASQTGGDVVDRCLRRERIWI